MTKFEMLNLESMITIQYIATKIGKPSMNESMGFERRCETADFLNRDHIGLKLEKMEYELCVWCNKRTVTINSQ